jgi:hypothetical protein
LHEPERWQELADFAVEMDSNGKRIHFTFFLSGINFIADANRMLYRGPQQFQRNAGRCLQ